VRLFLGTHRHYWLWDERFIDVPLFVSHHQLKARKTTFPAAVTTYAVDSGAFSHLNREGRWTETPEEYVTALRRYQTELGPFEFAGQQDSICQPAVRDRIEEVTGTRPSVEDLQGDTVANYLRLCEIAPDLPIVPTIQGDVFEDYLRCADMFEAAGVDLASLPVVGVGSLVGRPPAFIERVGAGLTARGLTTLHGFGVKGAGLDAAGHHMATADSNAWSYAGRRRPLADCTHTNPSCAHCTRYALLWWEASRVRVEQGSPQLSLAI
jgi:hypothetical protein